MNKLFTAAVGVLGTITLVIFSLWMWQHAQEIARGWSARRIDVAVWSVRSFSIAAAAAAQVLLISFVVQRLYERDWIGDLIRLGAGLLCVLAVVGAVALNWAGR